MNGGSLQNLMRSMDDKQEASPKSTANELETRECGPFLWRPTLAPILFILQQDLTVRADTGCEMRTGEGRDAGKRDRRVDFLYLAHAFPIRWVRSREVAAGLWQCCSLGEIW